MNIEKLNMNFKTLIVLLTFVFALGGFYYTTTAEINLLSLRAKGLQTENHDMRKRLDSLDKKIFKINKKIKDLQK